MDNFQPVQAQSSVAAELLSLEIFRNQTSLFHLKHLRVFKNKQRHIIDVIYLHLLQCLECNAEC